MAERLTKRLIDNLAPSEKDAFFWDKELSGFGARIWPSGRITFIAKYRVGGGRSGATRRLAIGTYGALTVDEARALAKKALGSVAHGEDPAGAKQAKRREMTVGQLIELYGKEGTDHLKPRNKR